MNEPSTKEPNTTLADFLRTGKLGELALGMNAETLLNYAGLPDGIQSVEDFYAWYHNRLQSGDIGLPYVGFDHPYIPFLYDKIEVWIADYKIGRIQFEVDYIDYHELRPALKFDWLETVFQMTTQDFRQYVHEHQIPCEFLRSPLVEKYGNVYIPLYIPISGVYVIIDVEDGADNVYSFSMDIHDFYTYDMPEPW